MSESVLTIPPPPADVRLAYGDGPDHFADLRLPAGDGPAPVVVVVHGGFWRVRYNLDHVGHLCAALAAEGMATYSVEYRRLGQPGGGWPGTFLDVARAVDHLPVVAQDYSLDLARVVVAGHSAGGHLALWLAARSRLPAGSPLPSAATVRPAGVVALAAVADLCLASQLRLSAGVVDELLGGPLDAVPDRLAAASPFELLPLGVPQVLLHGDADTIVPPEMSRRYVERARALGDDATLVTLPGAGHFEPIDPRSDAWPAVRDAIQHLARRTRRMP